MVVFNSPLDFQRTTGEFARTVKFRTYSVFFGCFTHEPPLEIESDPIGFFKFPTEFFEKVDFTVNFQNETRDISKNFFNKILNLIGTDGTFIKNHQNGNEQFLESNPEFNFKFSAMKKLNFFLQHVKQPEFHT